MIVYFKRSWEFCLSPTCHSWKIAWKSRYIWKIFTTKKNLALPTYFRTTNIFRYLTDKWKRSWSFIKTPQYFLSYRVTKTTVYSLSNPSCVRQTPWCKVYCHLWKWIYLQEFRFWNFRIFIWREDKEKITFSKNCIYYMMDQLTIASLRYSM